MSGDSHQRAMDRARNKKIAEQVADTVLERLGGADPRQKQPKSISKKWLDFIEHPAVLGALFALGGLVGTLLYTPFFMLCAVCILLGFHRSGLIEGKTRQSQVAAYFGLALFLGISGYLLYGQLDKALNKLQARFAEKVVARIVAIPKQQENTSQPVPPKRPTVTAAQVEEIRQLDLFLVRHDDQELEKQFGFDAMMSRNIQMVRDRTIAFRKTGDKYNFNIIPYQFDGGQMLMSANDLNVRRTGPGGVATDALPADRVFVIMLPKEFIDGRAKLSEFERSPELPDSIISTVRDFNAAVYQNAEILRTVLDAALQEDPNNFLLHDEVGSFYWLRIDALYREERIHLDSKADAVRNAIRKFLGVP